MLHEGQVCQTLQVTGRKANSSGMDEREITVHLSPKRRAAPDGPR